MNTTKDSSSISTFFACCLLLVCIIWPVSDFGVGNLADQDFQSARLPLYVLLFLAIGSAYALLLKLLFRSIDSGLALLVASVGIFLALNYYLITQQVEKSPDVQNPALTGVLIFSAIFTLTAGLLLWRRARAIVPVLSVAMLFGLGIVTLQNCWKLGQHIFFTDAGQAALRQATDRFDRWPTDRRRLNENVHFGERSSIKPPNIYFIIPDMFMGESEYQTMTGERYAMGDLLRKRGFKVLDNYYSNAPITRLSLAHVFGREYFAEESVPLTTQSMLALPWRSDSDVVREFRDRGYNINYYVDTFVNADCDNLADYCFTKKSEMHPQDLVFFERTPLFDVLGLIGDERAEVWNRLIKYPYWYEIPEVLEDLPAAGASPHFTFMHFGLPHSPYRYTDQCEYYDAYPPIRKDKYLGSIKAYQQHVKCAEIQYPLLLDTILENDPDAWIIFQADHGVNYKGQSTGADILAFDDQTIGENLSILGAYKLPQRCLNTIPEDMTPVNTFRVVFACLDGTEPELLRARHYLMYYLSWQSKGTVREVTETVRQRARSLR